LKRQLRALLSPLLNVFEAGEDAYAYKPSHRLILKVVGSLFLVLASGAISVGILFQQYGAAIPGVVFFGLSFTCFVVGFLGNDRAVAKLWGNRS
jgi:uncharacterized membrane protein